MQPVDLVGSFAAFFSTVSFVPQVWKTVRTRDTQSISLLMYSLFLIGVLGWLTWAVMLSQWPAVAGALL